MSQGSTLADGAVPDSGHGEGLVVVVSYFVFERRDTSSDANQIASLSFPV